MSERRSVFTMRVLFFTYLALVVLLVTSCQKQQDENQIVTTDCVQNPSLCQNGIYQQTPGFTPYHSYGNNGYNNGYPGYAGIHSINNSAYLCNCPNGTMPTYNSYGGLGCVQSGLVGGYGYAYLSLTGVNNQHWTNIPQISNLSGYSSNGCYNGVVQSCIVNGAATCSSGYTCRPTSAASAIGLCVSLSGNNQLGQIYR